MIIALCYKSVTFFSWEYNYIDFKLVPISEYNLLLALSLINSIEVEDSFFFLNIDIFRCIQWFMFWTFTLYIIFLFVS